MRAWHILCSRVRSVFFRNRREHDLSEELRLHIERQAEEWIAHGLDPQEARLRARRQFGNLELLKEQSRDARGTAGWDHFVRDLRHAARRLVRDWRFTTAAVLLLALGIGVNTAIFSAINAALLRGAPIADPDRLVEIYQNGPGGVPGTTTYPAYLDMAAYPGVFAATMAASMPDDVTYRDQGPVLNGVAEFTTASYLSVLGLRPTLGRWFDEREDRTGTDIVAVLGHQTWLTRFNSDPSIIGRTIRIEGLPVTIVGIGPVGYTGTMNIGVYTDFWLPIASAPGVTARPRMLDRKVPEAPFFVKARLRDGVTLEQARAAMQLLGSRLATDYPNEDAGAGISVLAMGDVRVHPQIDTILVATASLLLGVLGLVLTIACSNLATLLLVRASARAKEVAVRLAIGATRGQIVRHLLTESLLLSLAGGVGGCAIAWSLIRSLPAVELPISVDFHVDGTVLTFAVLLSLVTGVLFGLAPALKATRLDLLPAIRQDGHPGSAGHRWFTLRNGLVVFQITASVVLLAVTGIFLQMVVAARARPVGFAVDRVAMLETDVRYGSDFGARVGDVYEELRRRISAVPGVARAVLARGEVMSAIGLPVVIDRDAAGQVPKRAGAIWAGPGFFDVMQIPILVGRAIDERDRPGAPMSAVVSESMARDYFGSVNALGRRFRIDGQEAWYEVIGVARDTGTDDRVGDLVDPVTQLFFRPFAQAQLAPTTVLARTSLDGDALVGAMRRELLALDPSLPVFKASTMAADLERPLAVPRTIAAVLGALGALGMLLSGIGLYAVIAFVVSRRAREIGIRMALGARSSDVAWGVVADVGVLLGVGAGSGLLLATLVALAMRAFSNPMPGLSLYSPELDPVGLFAIVAFVSLVGVAAAFLPARRAARMDPLSALRRE